MNQLSNQSLSVACGLALDHTSFVPRVLAGALGSGADRDAQFDWLQARAATAWTAQRMHAALLDQLQAVEWVDAVLKGERVQPLVVTQALSQRSGMARHIELLASALRTVRRDVVVGTLVRDVAGLADLNEVMCAMTTLAELAVQYAVAALGQQLAARHGVPTDPRGVPVDLLVVAMGKCGGSELNVSSDLDLVFVYDEEGETQAASGQHVKKLANHEFFERLGRSLIALLSDINAHGYVFRVDMRLRPHGDSGPLAVSNAMIEEYLVRDARTWERFAWLKGRVICGPVFSDEQRFQSQVAALDSLIRPFVFRKYLDFNAIVALRDVHRQIRAQTMRKTAGRNHVGPNVKLGRGGIREIEFIAQTFQIMRGGREPALAAVARSTLGTLAQLPQLNALDEAECGRLADAYHFLRRLEHALQYVDDAQTHTLPVDPDAGAHVARLLCVDSFEALMKCYSEITDFVATTFDRVFQTQSDAMQDEEAQEVFEQEAYAKRLKQLGFSQPEESSARVVAALGGRRIAACPESSRQLIERLLLRAADEIARAARQATTEHDMAAFVRAGLSFDDVLMRFVRLLDTIAGRSTYLTLLAQYPHAVTHVLRLLSASGWAADYLALHPILLDELLDEQTLDNLNDLSQWENWANTVRERLQALGGDVEAQMNVLRDVHHAQTFRLLLADLSGRLTVERLADHLTALADQVVGLVIEGAWATVPKRHRPNPAYAVIGYGKYGGKELGYASDLDLVLLYDDPAPEAAEVYGMLTRRVVNWLSAHTSSGVLFDIDLRLRPDGDSGLLFSSFDAFAVYQRNANPTGKGSGAWTWEHQALTRARFCVGDPVLGQRFEALRTEILTRPRDRNRLAADVKKMRLRMHQGHPNQSALFDVKHDAGGMVDVEFIVQYLVLAHAHDHPKLCANLGNITLLHLAATLGLLEQESAQACASAYRTYRRIQHRLRMNNAQYARVPFEEVESERQAVHALWQSVFVD